MDRIKIKRIISAILICALLIISPIIGGGYGNLTNCILELLAFCALAFFLFSGLPNWNRAPGIVAILLFLLLCTISLIFGESIYLGIRFLLLFGGCFACYVSAAGINDSRFNILALWGLSIVAFVICVISIRDYAILLGGGSLFWKTILSGDSENRLFGTFINTSFFAGFLVITIPITLGLYLISRKTTIAFFAATACVIQFMALLLTAAKFGIASFILGLIAFGLLAVMTKSYVKGIGYRLIIITILFFCVLMFFSGPLRTRVQRSQKVEGSEIHSTTFRIYTWKGTINAIRANQIFGTGPGTFTVSYPRYAISGPTHNAHQSYLQIASEVGIPALNVFLIILVCISVLPAISIRKLDLDEDNWPQLYDKSTIWEDIFPSGSKKLLCCAMIGALFASMTRNLADSDWYVIGIAIPFWTVAGLLSSISATTKINQSISKFTKIDLGILLSISALLCISFSLGGLYEPDKENLRNLSIASALSCYEKAAFYAPLNPEYWRDIAYLKTSQ